ncbi:haloacid dehalogenase type II [Bacillus solimangrovi]|uniref:Haloacid dehalogenase, type II n=1 Tax=Bacillus solimangrovi TaxID=1305675 RepID=A0A1E5LCD9_9BACI|nr:haloacid dehalogenase type II [Bacillus solimangrovi]OEH91754.1 haloacid dehalogenase, type II [Bacillus solimangrovi]
MTENIKAYVFDAYGTLFDVYSVFEEVEDIFPDKGEEISQLWRQKQIEYSFIRELIGRYRPFSQVTKEALQFACEQAGVSLNKEQEIRLMKKYNELTLYPEVKDVLHQLNPKQKAIFSNGSSDMLNPLIERYSLMNDLDSLITADLRKFYKPVPASYMTVIETLHVKRENVLFMSSNSWDIIGAKSFGFNTAWINRGGKVMDKLGIDPDFVYKDLTGILDHV